MAKEPKFRRDGEPDGRGHADGSKPTRLKRDDGRVRPGRPKGAISMKSAYAKAAALPVYSQDRTQKYSTLEAIAMRQRDKALKGDEKATKRFEERIAEFFPDEVDQFRIKRLLEEDLDILRDGEARGILPPPPDQTPPPCPPAEDAEDENDGENDQ